MWRPAIILNRIDIYDTARLSFISLGYHPRGTL